ncbi:MAG TPA: hypothetical protein ENI20_11365 [Bacteroides sp.]|nr:hypothetical protein [Bacteroides sp.]
MYQSKQVHRYEDEQVLKIAFNGSGMEVSKFRIVEIITPKVLSKRQIKENWKGFYAGIGGTVNQNHLLYDHPFMENPYPHIENTPLLSYSFGAIAQYNFGASAGFQIELVYRNYKVSQTINSYEIIDNTFLIDEENDRYNRIAEVDSFGSQLNITMIDIPVLLNLRPYASPKVAWNLQLGVRNQIILNASSIMTGNVEYKGFYPDYPVVLYGLPEYGFTSDRYPGEETELKTDKYTLLGSFGTGLDFRFSKQWLLSIGVRLDYSLLDFNITHMALNEDYHDLIMPSSSKIMVYNVYINLLYKIY